ncbi:PQ loop repeat family protein [Leishmania donovani]|uniref:Mannose-P-dolichol utilization defect 1 protein homolog n=1 Tax=Leishmania donovani TaxID=5661 RepID=A0A504XXT6_LEIDO|nr:PQ loop repeat family protein [Leishmania donovani]TPP53433.1 PQ loop repeat family protein [Leishmania donovani]
MSVESIMRELVSNYLSYAVVVGSSILKVPQILKVWHNHKADGISLLSLLIELLSYIISTSWGLLALCAFASGQVPRTIHEYVLSGQVFFNMFSRVPQIYANYRTRCRGQLSFLTFFLAFGGGVARVLTTSLNVSWDKGKAVLLVQFGVAATLNAVILAQILYYGIADRRFKRAKWSHAKAKSLKSQ